jgi:hypothetical protein
LLPFWEQVGPVHTTTVDPSGKAVFTDVVEDDDDDDWVVSELDSENSGG